MPLRIGRALKKVVSIAAGIIGIGTGGGIAIGELITGDVILDAILMIGCLVIIAINGKDGVPDWLIRRIGGTPPTEGEEG